MTDVVPETLRRNARPPMSMDAAPASGTASVTRTTARPRSWVTPLLFDRTATGHRPDDPAVRRYWTAVIGPSAVAELLRLIAAARDGRRIRRPLRLSVLASEGLVEYEGDIVLVRPTIPRLGDSQLRRLRPALRAEYTAQLDSSP
jgi:hypothetical protein